MSHRFGPRTRMLGSGASRRVAQWFQRSQVRSLQRGTITIVGATTNTAAITSVDVNNSRLRNLGYSNNNGAGAPQSSCVRLTLTNATTITATHDVDVGDTGIVSYEIIEYWPGVIRSVQRGTITITGAATGTAAITAVTTGKTELDNLGNQPAANLDTLLARLVLTNTTTITATRSSAAATNTIVGYQAVEWY